MGKSIADVLKKDVIRMTNLSKTSHVGGCLSCIDIIDVLYSEIMNINSKNPKSERRDRFILSKGHTAAVVYSALANKGFFSSELLDTFFEDGTMLPGHIDHRVPGVEFSTGSLGHGLSVGTGIALSLRKKKSKSKVYVLISDGEMNSGSTWESIMFAGHHKISNLICLVDKNSFQAMGKTSSILNLNPLDEKWKCFGWRTYNIDGHNNKEIKSALNGAKKSSNKPTVIICNTIKGKGLKGFEGKLLSHYRPPGDKDLSDFIKGAIDEK